MRAADSPLQQRSARKWRLRGRPRSGSPWSIASPSFPTQLDRLKDEVRLKAGVFCAPHQGTQKYCLEVTTVIGEVTMRLAKGRNDLRHLKTERPARVGERGSMTMRVSLVSFGRVRPDLDALPRKRSSVARAAHGARHPEAPAADPRNDRRAPQVVVGPALHRRGRREPLRAGGRQEWGNPGCYDAGANGEEAAAVEKDD